MFKDRFVDTDLLCTHGLRLKPLWTVLAGCEFWKPFPGPDSAEIKPETSAWRQAEVSLSWGTRSPGCHEVWCEQQQSQISYSTPLWWILMPFPCFWRQVCWAQQLVDWALPVPLFIPVCISVVSVNSIIYKITRFSPILLFLLMFFPQKPKNHLWWLWLYTKNMPIFSQQAFSLPNSTHTAAFSL